jgi:hypothetical protein
VSLLLAAVGARSLLARLVAVVVELLGGLMVREPMAELASSASMVELAGVDQMVVQPGALSQHPQLALMGVTILVAPAVVLVGLGQVQVQQERSGAAAVVVALLVALLPVVQVVQAVLETCGHVTRSMAGRADQLALVAAGGHLEVIQS